MNSDIFLTVRGGGGVSTSLDEYRVLCKRTLGIWTAKSAAEPADSVYRGTDCQLCKKNERRPKMAEFCGGSRVAEPRTRWQEEAASGREWARGGHLIFLL